MSGPVTNISRLVPGLVEKPSQSTGQVSGTPDDRANFTEVFSNMLQSVNELQQESGQLQEAFLNGEPVELHQVMIKAEEAGLATELLLEIRNRLISAYSELIRMPV